MSIESFFTTLVTQPGQTKATGAAALSGANQAGVNFLDFIMAQIDKLEDQQEHNATQSKADDPLQSDNPLLSKEAQLEIAKILAENPEIAEQIESYALGEGDTISETIALNQQAFDALMKPVMSPELKAELDALITTENLKEAQAQKIKLFEGLLADKQEAGLENNNKFKAMLEKLKALAENADPALIAGDLSPEQLFDLKQKIHQILSAPDAAEGDEQPVAGLFAGLVQIVNPSGKTGNLALNKQEFDLATRLNNMVVGGSNDGALEAEFESLKTELGEDGFEAILKKMGSSKKGADFNLANFTAATKADFSALPSLGFMSPDGMITPAGWSDDFAVGPMQPVNSLSALTDLGMQAQHASRAHPATQMVAATIQKSLSEGTNKSVILQLDPPELGKVEVRMEFGKDKSVKAHIISEKPETFMMLQRDAQMLERILQESGLSTDGGLNFELADQGYDFNHNGRHDGHAGGKGDSNTPGGADEDGTLIETTMTWHVDPETGHMRYNLMA